MGPRGGRGHRYESGAGLVPIRRAFVRDRDGTHRDEFSFSADAGLDPAKNIETYTARRNPEATRGWCRSPAPRMAPCLVGLYTAAAPRYRAPPGSKRSGRAGWPGETGVTCSGAPMAVRRRPWREWVTPQAGLSPVVQGLPEPVQDLPLDGLAPAAWITKNPHQSS